MQRFRGGLVFKAHRLLYHSTLGLRVINKKMDDAAVSSRMAPQHLFNMMLPTQCRGGQRESRVCRDALSSARKKEFTLPWREAGPPNHRDDKVDSDQ